MKIKMKLSKKQKNRIFKEKYEYYSILGSGSAKGYGKEDGTGFGYGILRISYSEYVHNKSCGACNGHGTIKGYADGFGNSKGEGWKDGKGSGRYEGGIFMSYEIIGQ